MLVCDMSSDIFSRTLDVSKFGIIFAGAQKNMGPAGVTVVIIREDLLSCTPDNVPTMLKYGTHADKDSMFNTPPTFAIYCMGRVIAPSAAAAPPSTTHFPGKVLKSWCAS